MKKNWAKMLVFMLVVVISVGLITACGKEKEKTTDQNKVALILEGAISDMSWNATAYEGLQKIEALGAHVRHVENTPIANAPDAIDTFARDGYNVIFMSSNSFEDVAREKYSDYPDVQFFLINSTFTEKNVRSFAINDSEQGFLMGALAALLSKTNKVGFIGGLPINPIINAAKGFEQGAKYVKPEITVMSQNTGNFDDVIAAKELAKAFASGGADVVAPLADQASLGVMEGAEESGILAVGSGLNQEKVAPNAAVVAIVKDTSIAYEAAYKSFVAGNMPEEILPMGAAEGVVYIGEYYKNIDDDIKAQINTILEKLKSGEIKINLD